jgi:predicted CXXCH cytochrome family protein
MRAFAFAAILGVALALFPGGAVAVNIGDKASAIKGEGLDGTQVDLGAYIGKKVILLKFGSIYCSTCVTSLEDVARIQKKFKPSDLQIVGVNLDVYGLARVKRFYRGYTSIIKYPFMVDAKLASSRPFDIQSIPAHVVIDKEGFVRYVSTGASPEDLKTLEEVITKVIKGEAVDKMMKEQPLQVFLPSNFSKTFQESVYVVGTAKSGSKLTLTLNGGSSQNIVSMRDLFYIRTPLSLGSNYIEVQVIDDQGGKVNQGIVIFREPKVGTGIESPFPIYYFHTEKNETPCKKCHDLNPPEGSAQGFKTATQFCLGCHKELTGNKHVHGPIPVGGCAPCHNFASRPHRYEPMASGQELCFKCHEDKRKELVKTFLHGPMSAGLCVVCHSPHSSNERFTIRRYVGDLCVMCHEGLKTVSTKKFVHKPVNDGNCTGCHDAHSSQRNDAFLKLPAEELCLSCHTGITRMTHTHPWGVPPKTDRPVKLDKQGNLTCSSCHMAHASDEPKLQHKGGCAKCHPPDKTFGAPLPAPAGG